MEDFFRAQRWQHSQQPLTAFFRVSLPCGPRPRGHMSYESHLLRMTASLKPIGGGHDVASTLNKHSRLPQHMRPHTDR